MKNRIGLAGFAMLSFAAVFLWGFSVGKYEVFPYQVLRTIKWTVADEIRVKTGKTQFDFFSPPSDVVFIGDSITAAGNWSEIFRGVSVANRGVRGETVQEIALRIDSILSVDPEKAFIMAGINDIYRHTDSSVLVNAYKDIVETLRTKGVDVYLQSTLECQRSECGGKLEKVRSVNQRLRAYANETPGVEWIDLNQALADVNGLQEQYTIDGIHLNAAGYVTWSELLRPHVY